MLIKPKAPPTNSKSPPCCTHPRLAHDDRVEGLSGLLSMFIDKLGVVPQEETEKAQEAIREQQAKELGQEIGNFRDEPARNGAGLVEVEVTLKGKLRGNW